MDTNRRSSLWADRGRPVVASRPAIPLMCAVVLVVTVGAAMAPAAGANSVRTDAGTAPAPGVPAAAGPIDSDPWAIQRTPNAVVEQGVLSGVACPSSSACLAVGSYTTSSNLELALAEVWNRAGWRIEKPADPRRGTLVSLSAVACRSSTACTAVGSFETSSNVEVTLAEAWDGTGWSILPTPNPSGATKSILNGVACTSTGTCTAVGSYLDSSDVVVTLAETWNGSVWSIDKTPDPSSATYSALEGVSCSSTGACTAVGSYFDGSGTEVTLAEASRGTVWNIEPTPNPAGAPGSELAGVSCRSTTMCAAVGSYQAAGEHLTLAETWNGTTWTVQPTPNPNGADQSGLSGVSCPATHDCTAVGSYTNGSHVGMTLAEGWNGTGWSLQSTPNPKEATSSGMSAVACISGRNCAAVGAHQGTVGTLTLSERWSGTVWSIAQTPNPRFVASSALASVACTSPNACTAVGNYFDGSSNITMTLAESWDGTRWTIEKTPNPDGAVQSSLQAVACISADECTAVGHYTNASNVDMTLAEKWNGTRWSLDKTPDIKGSSGSALYGITCGATGGCTAVGYDINSSHTEVTLAEASNGTTWSVEKTPDPKGAVASGLFGVACTTGRTCIAVGHDESSSGVTATLAEKWNGTTWAVEATPNPKGSVKSLLFGVSCDPTGPCTAVGWYAGPTAVASLAERWNGSRWSMERIRSPEGATYGALSEVACTTTSSCTAVGTYETSSSVEMTLVESWDGATWSTVRTPNPKGATGSNLSGVACTAPNGCIAVGLYAKSSNIEATLAEAGS